MRGGASVYLSVENISYSYGNIRALRDVSFSANLGEVTGIIGANGAGKTTAMRIITRYLVPQKGDVFIDGRSIRQWRNEDFPVSYIPDEPVFYEELTLLEHLHFVKALYPKNMQDIEGLIERFEFYDHINKVPSSLSKGNRQKLMIALALLREYQILIADEPFTGLDPNQIYNFKNILSEQRKMGKAVLLSTHLLDMIDNLCDRYVILHKGYLLAVGTKEDIQAAFDIEEAASLETIYLEITKRGEK
jgi:ABC-2 type transport system ATP-binding protein